MYKPFIIRKLIERGIVKTVKSAKKIVDFNDNASEEEAKEEKDYIDGYNLDVDKLVFGEILISMPGRHYVPLIARGYVLYADTT